MLLALKMEEGDPRNVGDIQELEKARNGFSPRASRKEHSLADTLIFFCPVKPKLDFCQVVR